MIAEEERDIITAVKNISLKKGIEILDLGCNKGSYWFDLFKEIKFKSITGIELKTKEEINQVNNYDRYKDYLTEEEFNSTFKVHYETDAFDYLKSIEGEKFDLIIMSDFLYLLATTDDEKRIIQLVKSYIKPNGFLYIETNDESRRRKYRNEFPDKDPYKFDVIERNGFQKLLSPELEIVFRNSTGGYHAVKILSKKIN